MEGKSPTDKLRKISSKTVILRIISQVHHRGVRMMLLGFICLLQNTCVQSAKHITYESHFLYAGVLKTSWKFLRLCPRSCSISLSIEASKPSNFKAEIRQGKCDSGPTKCDSTEGISIERKKKAADVVKSWFIEESNWHKWYIWVTPSFMGTILDQNFICFDMKNVPIQVDAIDELTLLTKSSMNLSHHVFIWAVWHSTSTSTGITGKSAGAILSHCKKGQQSCSLTVILRELQYPWFAMFLATTNKQEWIERHDALSLLQLGVAHKNELSWFATMLSGSSQCILNSSWDT